MNLRKEIKKEAFAVKFIAEEGGREAGRVYLYVLKNDLHKEPFGLMEDLFVEAEYRSRGIGSQLVQSAIEEAKKQGCYKLLLTSREENNFLHKYYEKFGFRDHGREFRIDIAK